MQARSLAELAVPLGRTCCSSSIAASSARGDVIWSGPQRASAYDREMAELSQASWCLLGRVQARSLHSDISIVEMLARGTTAIHTILHYTYSSSLKKDGDDERSR